MVSTLTKIVLSDLFDNEIVHIEIHECLFQDKDTILCILTIC